MDLQALAILSNMVVELEPEALCMLGKHLDTELQPWPIFQVLNWVISMLSCRSLYTGVPTCRHTHAHTQTCTLVE